MKAEELQLQRAIKEYKHQYGKFPDVAVFAPGRVNLIGEHTDYNDGFVLPFALPFRTFIVGSKADKDTDDCQIFSCNMNRSNTLPVTFKADKSLGKGDPSWSNYLKGTVFQYLNDLPKRVAFNAVVSSNVPLGSGLSSSAAFEVATATFLEELYNIRTVSKVQKALRSQTAEHDFAGTPCGIMDQFISAMGKENNLLLIDCRDQTSTLVPFGSDNNCPVVLITNSNVQHELSGSEYPDRVKQCKEAVEILSRSYPQVRALRDATLEMLNEVKDTMSDLVFRRARHVISENARTLEAADALRRGDFVTVGRLMNASHESLSKDYEVSCSELDLLQNLALQVPGVFGSRMTGGGFGGCTVTLVDAAVAGKLESILTEKYFEATKAQCVCYQVTPSDGSGRCEMNLTTTTTATTKGKATSWSANNNKNDDENRASNNFDVSVLLHWLVPITVVALAAVVGFRHFRKK